MAAADETLGDGPESVARTSSSSIGDESEELGDEGGSSIVDSSPARGSGRDAVAALRRSFNSDSGGESDGGGGGEDADDAILATLRERLGKIDGPSTILGPGAGTAPETTSSDDDPVLQALLERSENVLGERANMDGDFDAAAHYAAVAAGLEERMGGDGALERPGAQGAGGVPEDPEDVIRRVRDRLGLEDWEQEPADGATSVVEAHIDGDAAAGVEVNGDGVDIDGEAAFGALAFGEKAAADENAACAAMVEEHRVSGTTASIAQTSEDVLRVREALDRLTLKDTTDAADTNEAVRDATDAAPGLSVVGTDGGEAIPGKVTIEVRDIGLADVKGGVTTGVAAAAASSSREEQIVNNLVAEVRPCVGCRSVPVVEIRSCGCLYYDMQLSRCVVEHTMICIRSLTIFTTVLAASSTSSSRFFCRSFRRACLVTRRRRGRLVSHGRCVFVLARSM